MNVKNYFLVSLLTLGLIGMPNAMQAARSEAVAPSQQAKDTRTVTGTVVDSYNGEAIIGAYVQEKDNPNNVVTTDVDGTFAINVSKKKAGIEVSYVGYKAASFDVTGMTDIQIKLESEAGRRGGRSRRGYAEESLDHGRDHLGRRRAAAHAHLVAHGRSRG